MLLSSVKLFRSVQTVLNFSVWVSGTEFTCMSATVWVWVNSIHRYSNDLKHKSSWLGLQLKHSSSREARGRRLKQLRLFTWKFGSLAVCLRSGPHSSTNREFYFLLLTKTNSNCGQSKTNVSFLCQSYYLFYHQPVDSYVSSGCCVLLSLGYLFPWLTTNVHASVFCEGSSS